jgi:iron complex transport system substrate-binding protein
MLLSMEGNVREDFKRLTTLNVPVFVSNPRDLDGIYRSIEQMGALTGRHDSAMTFVGTLRRKADSLITLAGMRKQERVLLIVSLQPLIVVGSGSFLAELITLAGGENIAGSLSSTFPTYSREAVVAENPDVLIVVTGMGDASTLTSLYPEWKRLDAVKSGRVVQIDADIVARPGPRVVEGLELLYRSIHQIH